MLIASCLFIIFLVAVQLEHRPDLGNIRDVWNLVRDGRTPGIVIGEEEADCLIPSGLTTNSENRTLTLDEAHNLSRRISRISEIRRELHEIQMKLP